MPRPIPRGTIDRWSVLQSLVRRLDALLQMNSYLDTTLARGDMGRAARYADRLADEMDRLTLAVEREATRVTVEAGERYIARQNAKAKRQGIA